MKRLLISLLLTVMIGCQAEPPDEERKLPNEEALPATAQSPGQGQTIDRKREEPVELDDNHLLTIKASSNGRAVFSPDGERIVARYYDKKRNGYSLKTWDSETGKLVATFQATERSNSSSLPLEPKIAYSPDRKRIVSILRNEPMKIWDAETGQQLLALKGHTSNANGVSFSPDGKQIISGDYYNKVILWDADSGQLLRTIEGPSLEDHKYVLATAFSADTKRVATGYQSFSTTVAIWSLPAIATESSTSPITVSAEKSLILKGNTGVVSDMSFSPDGTRIVIAEYIHFPQGILGDEVIQAKIWDCKTGKVLVDLQGHTEGIRSVAFSPDGKQIVSGGQDKTVRLWDAESGQPIKTLRGHTDEVKSVSFSPDGNRLLSGSKDGNIMLWDVSE